MGLKLPPKQITRQNIERVAGAPDRRQLDNFDTTGVFDQGGAELESFGKTVQNLAVDEALYARKQQAAIDKANFDYMSNLEKNRASASLQGAETELDTLLDKSDLSTQEGVEQYTQDFNRITEKYENPAGIGLPAHQDDYATKFHNLRLKKSAVGGLKITEVTKQVNQARVDAGLNKIKNSFPVDNPPDPRDVERKFAESIENNGGSMSQFDKNASLEKGMGTFFGDRIDYLTAHGRLDEVQALLDSDIGQRYVGEGIRDTTRTAMQEARKSLGDSAKIEEMKTKREHNLLFFKGLQELAEKVKDPDILRMLRDDYFRAFGKTPPPSVTLSQGQTQVGPGGNPIASVSAKPLVVPEGSSVVTFNSDNEASYVIEPDADATPLKSDLVDQSGNLTTEANAEIRHTIEAFLPLPSGPEGNPIIDDKASALMGNLANNMSIGIRNGAYKSVDEAYFSEFAKIPEDQLPDNFSHVDSMNEILGKDRTIPVDMTNGTLTGDIKKNEASIAKVENDINAGLKQIGHINNEGKIDLNDATGFFSGLKDGWGSLFGSFVKGAVTPKVTVARFQYGLLVRDFVRMFTLSPRFAVKEQELLRSMFPGPGVFNVEGQAEAALDQFRKEINTSIQEKQDIIRITQNSHKAKAEALGDLRRLVQMRNRVERFDLGSNDLSSVDMSAITEVEKRDMITGASLEQLRELWEKDPEKFKTLTEKYNPVPAAPPATPDAPVPADTPRVDLPKATPDAPAPEIVKPNEETKNSGVDTPALDAVNHALKTGDFSQLSLPILFDALTMMDLNDAQQKLIKTELGVRAGDTPKPKQSPADTPRVDLPKATPDTPTVRDAEDALSNVSMEQVDEYVDSLFIENPDFNAANLKALDLPHTTKGDAIRDKAREQISSRKSEKKKSLKPVEGKSLDSNMKGRSGKELQKMRTDGSYFYSDEDIQAQIDMYESERDNLSQSDIRFLSILIDILKTREFIRNKSKPKQKKKKK